MKEKNELSQENKSNRTRIKMTFAILILAVLSVVELYLMMNFPKSYLILGIVGLAILCFVYLITDLSFKLQNEKEDIHRKEYESIYKAQKVSYVLMKQSFLDMEKVLDRIKENSDVPADELIQAQKAVGKVTIQRNKENALAIINSNNQLADRLTMFEGKVEALADKMEQSKKDVQMLQKQQEMMETLTKAQDALKEEISELKAQMTSQINAVSDTIMEKLSENSSMLAAMPLPEERPLTEETSTIEETFDFTEEPAAIEELLTEEIPDVTEEPAAIEEPLIEAVSDVIEEPAAIEELLTEAEPEVTEEPAAIEEPLTVEVPDVTEEPVVIEEPLTVEKEEPPVVSGRNMTPDEIAALLQETEEAAEPPEAVKEEPPAMPDLSDPGHVMTPEEIAALLANM